MKLGINGWRIHGQRTGVGRYLLNVVKHWTAEAVSGIFDEINFYTPKPVDRRDTPIPENIRVRVLPPDCWMLVWENFRLGPSSRDDILFCPSYSRPLMAHGKTVVVTHDATQKLYPELFSRSVRILYTPLYQWSARRATLVLTTTHAARKDIAHCYGVPLDRIRVVHLAPAEVFRHLPGSSCVTAVRERYVGSPAPYFLFVGKLTGRRNIPRLLEAFAELKRRTSLPHKLLIIGPDTQTLNIASLGAQLGIADHLVQSNYAPDEDLNLLYNGAEAFVMPSTYETVSFPLMEAQATGTPVICIDTPGAREITGGAALLIPKLEVRELVDAMVRLAGDAGLRREFSEKGLSNSRRFSWQRCSVEHLSVLKEASKAASFSSHLALEDRTHD